MMGRLDGKWPLDFILNENGYEWGVLRSADGLCLTKKDQTVLVEIWNKESMVS